MTTADTISAVIRAVLDERKLYIVKPQHPTMGEIALEAYGFGKACDAIAFQGDDLKALLLEIGTRCTVIPTREEIDMKDAAAAKNESVNAAEDRLLGFLGVEFARKDGRQCVGVDLLYAPGDGYRDEEIRSWSQEDDSQLFGVPGSSPGSSPRIVALASAILDIAADEVVSKKAGKHRFVVRTRQHLGARATMSFSIHAEAAENGDKIVPDRDLGKRKRLLARVAGDVAAGIVSAPSKSTSTAEAIATVAVDVAEEILKRIGL